MTEKTQHPFTGLTRNPFSVHSPEELPPEQIERLFVEDYTKLPSIKRRKHTFIWGSRGSGKSFLLRYLEPKCQILKHGSFDDFLDCENPFIGIYAPCKKGEIDKSELNHYLDEPAALTITRHLLNLTIAEETVSTLSEQFPEEAITHSEAVDFAENVVGFFDHASIAPSEEEADKENNLAEQPFKWLESLLSAEKRRVAQYLHKVPFQDTQYTGATSGYHDFLLPMMRNVQALVGNGQIPVYILLDDAFHLSEGQQKILNTWIANRDQGVLCLKVSSPSERYKTFETLSHGAIEKPHDYTQVNIEEIYTRSSGDYSKKLRKIANRRLQLADIPADDIQDFLPKDQSEQERLEEIKEKMKDEWEEYPEDEKPGRKSDYVSRYAKARLFQELAQGRNPKSYAGFENLVHISSGIIRSFLDPVSLMFDEEVKGGKDPSEIDSLSPSLQDRVIKEYSEEFLVEEPEKMRKQLSSQERTHLDQLTTLVYSLGDLFYERLHDPESREPRLFSFTIRDEVAETSELRDVLDLGRRMQYFIKSTYPSKEGGGREDWYILNRRLAPMFKIDPTGFQGRIQLTSDLLKIGCEDSDEFVRRVLEIDRDQESLGKFTGGPADE